MHNAVESALVVEGGAMRGIFAAGVLDVFVEQGYKPFDVAVGVSAGATNLVGYLAGDHGRNRRVITDHACRTDFINWRRFLSGGHLCDVHWLWHQSFQDVPLNLDAFLGQPVPLWVVTTSARTGNACYFRVNETNLHDVLTASCSIPLAYRDFPHVDGEPMTDGGLADSIPVRWAYDQGARDLTVILSRPLGYRKRMSPLPNNVLRPLFRREPALGEAMLKRADRYNSALDFIDAPPADCTLRVIAPPPDFPVSRLTTDGERLEQGYQQGCEAGLAHLQQQQQQSVA